VKRLQLQICRDPYYGRLNPDQVYSVETPATSWPLSPGAGSIRPPTPPPTVPTGESVNTDGGQEEGAPALS
jgi:hypothetical protein